MNANGSAAPPWAALPVIIAGALMVVLDFFIVNVALPSIAADLDAHPAELEWIVASYAILETILLVTCGKLGDRLGRRRMYLIGVALFTLASLACAVAPSAGTLIAGRIAQGIAGAMLMPQVLAIIGVAFEGAARVKALAIYSMAMGLAAVAAQLVGGALIELDVAGLGWRTCFLINVPIGLAALVAAPRLVPESRAPSPGRVDLAGVVLLTLALTAVVMPLIEGREHGWPTWTWVSLGAAGVLLAAFLHRQRERGRRRTGVLVDRDERDRRHDRAHGGHASDPAERSHSPALLLSPAHCPALPWRGNSVRTELGVELLEPTTQGCPVPCAPISPCGEGALCYSGSGRSSPGQAPVVR
jgi:MFS family permease